MLIDLLPSTKSKMRILDTIYSEEGINIRNLIKKAKASPNLVVNYVDKLFKAEIIKIKGIGGDKKDYIKSLYFNFNSNLSKLFYKIIEVNKKDILSEKYKFIKPFITQIKNLKTKLIILVYGSYSRFAADKESDLDLWFIGSLTDKLKKDIEEIFSTFPKEYSITIETKEKFIKNIENPIHQNILKDNVILNNEESFFDILKKIKK